MNYKIEQIEGIGPAWAGKLATAGITDTEGLLRHCGDAAGRQRVAQASGVSADQLLKWVNLADLMRIKGVGSEYSELLEAAGVDTVKELRTRNAQNLAAKMEEVNAAKKLTRATPAPKVVEEWISEAGRLPAMVSH